VYVDVLVTTYRRPSDIARLLPNLDCQTYRAFRLQLFDGSPDDAVSDVVHAYLQDRRPASYEVVYRRTPSGMTRQRNIAVEHTDGDLSIFLDDDVELEPEYLSEIVRVFRSDVRGEIAGVNGYDLNAAQRLGRKKRIYRWLGLMPPIGCARYLPWGHPTVLQEGGEFEGVRDCDLLIGHNMAWRTPILKELRFDTFFTEYPTYVLYDDSDLSLRARQRYRLVQCGTARLRHLVSPDARPPGFHYGFQTVFNAHRNFRVHQPAARLADHLRFWAWEGIGAGLLALRSLGQPTYWPSVRGMLAGAIACMAGVASYGEWQHRRTSTPRSGAT